MLILTKDQAESLAFTSRDDAMPLHPVPLKDGSFALPYEALQSKERNAYLESLPRRPVASDEFL